MHADGLEFLGSGSVESHVSGMPAPDSSMTAVCYRYVGGMRPICHRRVALCHHYADGTGHSHPTDDLPTVVVIVGSGGIITGFGCELVIVFIPV